MNVRLKRVTMQVTETSDILVTREWDDGTRTMEWTGFWSAIKLTWRYLRAGVKVDTP